MISEVKNKRLKMSPAGVISLPVSARRALGMSRGTGAIVGISSTSEGIKLSGKPESGSATIKVSKGGQAVLPPLEKQYLIKAVKRHFWIQIHDAEKIAILRAF